MLTLPAPDVAAGDYVFPPKCDGAHRITSIRTDDSRTPTVPMVHLTFTEGTWSVRTTTDVRVAFSGVSLCTLDHNTRTEV